MYSDSTVKRSGPSPRAKQILIGIGSVFALLLGAILIYSVLVTPEKQPYRDALTQYKQVYDANVAFTNAAVALNSTPGTEAEAQARSTAVSTAKTALQTQTDALGKQAALSKGEGKDLYDAFASKVKSYIAYNETILDSRQKVQPVLSSADCSRALATSDSYADKEEPMRACAESFSALKDVGDADYRTLADAYAQKTSQLATIFEQIAALKDPKGEDASRQDELIAQHDDILTEIEAVNKTFANALQRNKAKVDITASAQALDSFLTRKSSVF